MDSKTDIDPEYKSYSKLDVAVEYLVRAFILQPNDAMSLDVKLRNGKKIHIHIAYVKESQ